MSLKIGIIGLPNVGKSTLFNALLKRRLAKVADFPFTTIDPHEGVVDVPDKRLQRIIDIVKPEEIIPATVTFVDIAGLVKDAHKGEGLGNEFLSNIREVDALLHLVRAFESETVQHVLGTIDPERDIEIIKTELILKDLQVIDKVLNEEKDSKRKDLLKKLRNAFDRGEVYDISELSDEQKKMLKEFSFLSLKPEFFAINISESMLTLENIKKLEDKDFLVISAKLESELADLKQKEQQEYLLSFGLPESGLSKVIKRAYSLLDFITFFTIKGGRQVRSWSIRKGSSAYEAAEKVHTDMAMGFIKAACISYDEFVKSTSWKQAEKKGRVRFEGRDYQVQDGDILEFKFSK